MNEQPNILLITADQLRFDCYGAEHSDWPQPKVLSRLRQDGTLLTNTYANCPICMPCRYTWLTGLYGSQTERGAANGKDWPDYHRTMPQALQAAGYHTALIGKLHAHTKRKLMQHHLGEFESTNKLWGFDEMFECSGRSIWSSGPKQPGPLEEYGIKGCYYADYLKERGLYDIALRENIERDQSEQLHDGLEPYRPGVLDVEDTMDAFVLRQMQEFIRNHNPEKPFFLHASFFAPHYPLDVPGDVFHRFRPEDMPPPIGITDREIIRRWQENRAMYCGLVSLVDEFIGRLLDSLEGKGLADDTVILFTTDHGDMLGDHGLHHKFHAYEGSCRTPLIARFPNAIPSGRTSPALAESADLPHTILDIAGLDEAARASALPASPGVSQWQVLQVQEATARTSAYSETRNNGRMLRMQNWKFSRTPGEEDRLYDLDADPGEINNRAGEVECLAIRESLDRELFRRMTSLRVPPLSTPGRKV
jgi:arylsulfatase A-like enzyme